MCDERRYSVVYCRNDLLQLMMTGQGEKVMDYDKIFEQFYKMNIELGKAMQEAEKKKAGVEDA